MSTPKEPQPYLIQFLSQSALAAGILFVPLVVKDMGGGGLSIGIVVAGYNTAYFLANMLGGRAGDIYPRRWIVRIGLLSASAAFLLQAVVIKEDAGIVPFALSRFIGGLAAGFFPNSLMAYVYEKTGKVGTFTSMGSMGWAAGMVLAGLAGSFSTVFLISTLLLATGFGVSMTLPPIGEKRMKIPLFPTELIKKNAVPYASLLLRHTAASMIWVTFPIFLTDLGATRFWVGIIYATNMTTQFTLMPFLDRFRSRTLAVTGFLFSILSFVSFTMARTWWEILPTQILLGSAWASLYVGILKCVLEKNDEKATVSGLVGSVLSLSGILGPIIGGPLSSVIGYRAVMVLAACVTGVALVIFAAGTKKRGRSEAQRG